MSLIFLTSESELIRCKGQSRELESGVGVKDIKAFDFVRCIYT